MRVLQLPSWYLPEGGHFCLHQTLALQEQGVEVHILANVVLPWRKYRYKVFGYPFNSFFTEEEGVTLLRNYAWKIPFVDEWNIKIWVARTVQLFDKYAKKYGLPDIIHVHSSMWGGYAAALIKEKYGVPYVITEHRGRFSSHSENMEILFKKSYTKYLNAAFSNASAIITVSDQLQEKVKTFTNGNVPIVTISNCLDTDFFSYQERLRMDDKFVFMNANSYHFAKGYDILLPAFDRVCLQHPNASLILLGEGFDNHAFVSLLNKVRCRNIIVFAGSHNREGVREYLRKSDCFVLSSRIESQSVALLEALSCGIPVVCTEAVPVEIVPPIVAIQCESNSVEALTIAMNQMIEKQKTFDPIEISKFAQSVCSKQVVASKIIQVYQSILTKNDSISTK